MIIIATGLERTHFSIRAFLVQILLIKLFSVLNWSQELLLEAQYFAFAKFKVTQYLEEEHGTGRSLHSQYDFLQ